MTTLDVARATKKDALLIVRGYIAAIKPRVIVECGTYPGVATDSIAYEAARANSGFITYERDDNLREQMREFFSLVPSVQVADVAKPPHFQHVDMVYLDSGPTYADRIEDLYTWFTTGKSGSVMFVDDATEGDWFQEHYNRGIILPTEQGLAVLVHE